MNFSESISTCMGKYGTFSGRASRSEFWWFYLFALLLQWGASVVGAVSLGGSGSDMAMGADILSGSVALALLMPGLASSVRRLHDIGRSGWWVLIAFTGIGLLLLIFWWAKEGEKIENSYGSMEQTFAG